MSAPTISVAAQSERGSQVSSGGDGLNSHDVHAADGSQTPPGVVGSNLPDPVHMTREDHRCVGGVGESSIVSVHDTRVSQGLSGADGFTPGELPSDTAKANNPLAVRPASTSMDSSNILLHVNEIVAGPSGSTSSVTSTMCADAKSPLAPLMDPFLTLAAEMLDDFEKVRIANENRLRQLTRDVTDTDGEERGFGLTLDNPDVGKVVGHVRALLCTSSVVTDLGVEKAERRKRGCCREHDAERDLTAKMRAHPLGGWVSETSGVGDKQAARLLASIGDPAWHHQEDRVRTLRELWSYCGYGDASVQVPRRGHKRNWSPAAKMRAHLVAVSCIKAAQSPFRTVYDDARADYEGTVHAEACRRCGPSGRPAEAGSPVSAGHQHARALRKVSKELLRALWIESRRIHGLTIEETT